MIKLTSIVEIPPNSECEHLFESISGKPGSRCYVCGKMLDALLIEEYWTENAQLREILVGLAKRHEWQPGMGPCVCEWHTKARALLSDG